MRIIHNGVEIANLKGQLEIHTSAGVTILEEDKTEVFLKKPRSGHYHVFSSKKWLKAEDQPNQKVCSK